MIWGNHPLQRETEARPWNRRIAWAVRGTNMGANHRSWREIKKIAMEREENKGGEQAREEGGCRCGRGGGRRIGKIS